MVARKLTRKGTRKATRKLRRKAHRKQVGGEITRIFNLKELNELEGEYRFQVAEGRAVILDTDDRDKVKPYLTNNRHHGKYDVMAVQKPGPKMTYEELLARAEKESDEYYKGNPPPNPYGHLHPALR